MRRFCLPRCAPSSSSRRFCCSLPATNKTRFPLFPSHLHHQQTTTSVLLLSAFRKMSSSSSTSNPLLVRSTLPCQFPPFDKIKNEHFAPAFEAAMAEHNTEIAAIAENKEPATFENTLVALERSGETLDRVNSVFQSLNIAHTNDTLQKLDVEVTPKLQAHKDALYMNAAIFQRVNELCEKKDSLNLDAESARLLWRYEQDFIRAGAKLSDADKEKLKALNGEIASLETFFQQAVLAEVVDSAVWFADAAELDGFSAEQLAKAKADADAAAEKADDKKKGGEYLVKLRNTTGQPSLQYLNKPESRQKIMAASMARGNHGGEYDTRETISKLAMKRAQRAQLLGFANHAEYVLADEMTKTPAAASELLKRVAGPSLAMARKEADELRKIASRDDITAADWDYYTEKLRAQKYSFDDSVLKPYFELERVLNDGFFYVVKQFYGISFVERKDLPVYHDTVRVFDVKDDDNNGQLIGMFVLDNFSRDQKQGGAWMNEYVGQAKLFDNRLPIIGNCNNVTKPHSPDEPTLLTLDEVRTIFHEGGHGIHGLLSDVTYPRFACTNVPRDFVEFPSQVNECWFLHPPVLKNYAKHHKTGEPIPDEFIEKLKAAERFNKGYETAEFAAACLVDQAWHRLKPEEVPPPEKVLEFEAQVLKECGMSEPLVPPRYRSTYFLHIFTAGYSAGYYSYLASQVLDSDGEQFFKDNGGVTRANGDRFRSIVLSKGGSEDPAEICKKFFGREPSIQPLLKRLGME